MVFTNSVEKVDLLAKMICQKQKGGGILTFTCGICFSLLWRKVHEWRRLEIMSVDQDINRPMDVAKQFNQKNDLLAAKVVHKKQKEGNYYLWFQLLLLLPVEEGAWVAAAWDCAWG